MALGDPVDLQAIFARFLIASYATYPPQCNTFFRQRVTDHFGLEGI
jgi:hypothetical protein